MSLPSIPNLSSSSLEPATGPRFSCVVIQGDSAIKPWFLIFIIVQANLRLIILLPQPAMLGLQAGTISATCYQAVACARLGRVRETETRALF